MKIGLTLLILAVLLVTQGCGPKRLPMVVTVKPITAEEAGELRKRLETGEPILPNVPLIPSLPAPGPSQNPPADEGRTAVPLPPVERKPQQPAAPGNSSTDSTSLTPICQAFVNSLPQGFEHATISVPEDWSNPEGRKIRVFYYWRAQQSAAGETAPFLAFFNGGPASDSHSFKNGILARVQSRSFSVVFIDQRGTGCSAPYDATSFDESTVRRLALYGSRSIVRDAEAIREKLLGSNSKWQIFGQSYGALIVHRYATIAPQHVSTASAHGWALIDGVSFITERIRAQNRVAENYFEVFTQDRKMLKTVRDQIPANRCYEQKPIKVCGPAVLDAFTSILVFRPSWRTLHDQLSALLRADETLHEDALDRFVTLFVFGLRMGPNAFPSAVLSALEMTPGLTDAEACKQAEDELIKQGEKIAHLTFNECRLVKQFNRPWEVELLKFLQAGVLDPVVLDALSDSLAAHPELRFFLYSGQKDTAVPSSIFTPEVTKLGQRITYRDFPRSGHEGYATEQQVWQDLLSH